MQPVNRIDAILSLQYGDLMRRREKVKKVQLGTYVTQDTLDALHELSDDSGVPITRIVETALRDFLRKNYRIDGAHEHE